MREEFSSICSSATNDVKRLGVRQREREREFFPNETFEFYEESSFEWAVTPD